MRAHEAPPTRLEWEFQSVQAMSAMVVFGATQTYGSIAGNGAVNFGQCLVGSACAAFRIASVSGCKSITEIVMSLISLSELNFM